MADDSKTNEPNMPEAEKPPVEPEHFPTDTEKPPTDTEKPPTETEKPPTGTEKPPAETVVALEKNEPKPAKTGHSKCFILVKPVQFAEQPEPFLLEVTPEELVIPSTGSLEVKIRNPTEETLNVHAYFDSFFWLMKIKGQDCNINPGGSKSMCFGTKVLEPGETLDLNIGYHDAQYKERLGPQRCYYGCDEKCKEHRKESKVIILNVPPCERTKYNYDRPEGQLLIKYHSNKINCSSAGRVCESKVYYSVKVMDLHLKDETKEYKKYREQFLELLLDYPETGGPPKKWAWIDGVTGATCPSHIDGVKCTRNGECPSDSRCLFGNDDPPGYGYCCQLKKHGYYNAMFFELIDDPDSRLPADLLEPVSVKETCDNSRDCVYPEVCMVSRRFEKHEEIPPILKITEQSRIRKHCYKKSPHWTTIPSTYSVQFCNPESECSNNHCFKMSSSKLIKTKLTRVWETEKVVIHHSFFKGHYSNLVPFAVLKMEEIDEIDENNVIWDMEIKDIRWFSDNNNKHCAFKIRGKRLEKSPKTSIRVRQPELICNGVREDFSGDLEIFGAKLTFQMEKEQFDGLCGHPNLNCTDCLINHKLFTCTENTKCYTTADYDWTNRNLKSFCSEETYNGARLCKREPFTCPPDSLESDGITPKKGACLNDEECWNTESFMKVFEGRKEIFHPHCFNGVCCARRELCPNHKFPYALPLEANAMRDPEPCHSDDDCNMFHNAIGTCVFHDSVRKVFELRDKKYLNTTMITRNSLYGMCCYTEEHGCAYGGRPLKDDLTVSNCTLQSDCNPDKPTYEWTAYCSQNEKKSSECCTDERPNIFCPDSFTPFRTQPKCDNVRPDDEFSGNCPEGKENGICYRGYCCSQLKIDRFKFSTPSEYNFLTNTPCDPTKPLERVYQWSYCDPETEKIMILGRKAPNGKMLEEETRTCLKVWESNEPQSWAMITVLLACILGIIVIFMCMPTPIFQ
ncbi:hypothetical protein CAEBREN_30145 [Caenorhabditis brenneri]|uniref:Domain of unknown function DX domain-containing protein n=1 Tax=Caenorhabditis brenneri TaxID=135651 RepID=G0N4K2_CAEBE|nr:hypothetical protein CAEBREN_30145 [Caenorhabditis brenneri]